MQLRAVTKHEKQFQVDEEGGKHKSFTDILGNESLAQNVEPTSEDIVEQSRGATLCKPMT
jgi:hypothetical protein